jgi:hypothetical protein
VGPVSRAISGEQKQTQEHFQAHEASLEAPIVRLSRIEARFAHTESVSRPKATAIPRVPEPVRTIPPSANTAGPASAPPIPKQATTTQHTPPIPAQAAAPARNVTPALGSTIISSFPEIFPEFRGKQFSLLWRGGRDSFKARDFHDRCDGHPNTRTLIEGTRGNVFGSLTPVSWESGFKHKADASLKSFVFRLENPHNVPARSFALKAKKMDEAIRCDSHCGPHFWDILVSDKCNANRTVALLLVTADLVHGGEMLQVPVQTLMMKCNLFPGIEGCRAHFPWTSKSERKLQS